MNSTPTQNLQRNITLWGLTSNIVNTIIGAGIFVLPATVFIGIGSNSVLAYLVCGVFIALVMMCFAEAGSRVTKAGGPYAYIETAFGRYAGFMSANFFVLSAGFADAAVANAVVGVLSSYFTILSEPMAANIFYVILFGGLAVINVIGTKQGIGLVKFITVLKLLPILFLILFGWMAVNPDNLILKDLPSASRLAETSLLLFFAFQGSETALSVSGEVKNPKRTIPRAIFISTLLILIIYILIQLVAQGVLGDSLADHPENPLAETSRMAFGAFGFTLLSIAATISMFGTLSSEILSVPRVVFSSARDGIVPPKALARIHPKFGTPYIAILAYTLLSLILSISGGFRFLAIMSNVFVILLYLGVVVSVFKLRYVTETDAETFVMPGGKIIPVSALIIVFLLLTGLSFFELMTSLAGIAVLTVIYFISKKITDR